VFKILDLEVQNEKKSKFQICANKKQDNKSKLRESKSSISNRLIITSNV
jgi:hypothetical protein